MSERGFQVGDHLSLECAPSDAEVSKIAGRYAFIAWPWREVDSRSQHRWNGQVAFPRSSDSFEWLNTPWRIEPDVGMLEEGDVCMVGIPPTRVIVRAVRSYDPAKDLGWLPRPSVGLSVVPVGDFEDDDEAGYMIYPNGAEPIIIHQI
ncbi:hypothetical protein ACFWOB_15105 [Streptomyces sp. NPDC058420]|uniref:hypothetical protein n=1 Tax=Streptomyces sp. NPDC058420 TaxID=3346489 RepID=UPI0036569464